MVCYSDNLQATLYLIPLEQQRVDTSELSELMFGWFSAWLFSQQKFILDCYCSFDSDDNVSSDFCSFIYWVYVLFRCELV